MLGYIKCSQWHSLNVKHVTEITDPGKHKGDGSVVDQVCGSATAYRQGSGAGVRVGPAPGMLAAAAAFPQDI